jgi:hypothetical protein
VQTDSNKCKVNYWKEGQDKELTGGSPLKRRRSALDCSDVDEEEEEENKKKKHEEENKK